MTWREAVKQSYRKAAVRVSSSPLGRAIVTRYADGSAYRYDLRTHEIKKLDSLAVEGFTDWEPAS